MTIVSAHDVAAELRRRLPGVGVTQLQKLLYYTQGWHLVWAGEPLFHEAIEAWENGPVVADHWRDEKHDRARPWPIPLNQCQVAVVDYVVERYGRMTAGQLVAQTHAERPWQAVFGGADEVARFLQTIHHDALLAWFSEDPDYLAHLGEVQRLRRRHHRTLSPAPLTDAELAAVERALRGERVDQTQS